MVAHYHQTKTPISFWCRRGLNSRSLIQLSETLPVELIGTHKSNENLKYTIQSDKMGRKIKLNDVRKVKAREYNLVRHCDLCLQQKVLKSLIFAILNCVLQWISNVRRTYIGIYYLWYGNLKTMAVRGIIKLWSSMVL